MNSDWNDFLTIDTKNNADAAAQHAQEHAKASDGDIQCHLSQYGLIVVAGPDAASFMQGQFTNDVTKVDSEHAQLNAFCSNKGRMISNFTLFRYQENYFISIHKSLVETTIEHLQGYILSAQVAVQDVTEQLVPIGICGEIATKKLADMLQTSADTTLTNAQHSVSANSDYIAIKTADDMPRYHVFSEMEKAKKLWSSLNDEVTTVHNSAWEYLNIQAGIPVISENTQEMFVPQMANMELLGAVNFKKGCYTGQEIIARMHYLGKLKKRMYKVHIATTDKAQIPQAGDKVLAENARSGQNTGMLISAQPNPDGGYDALSVLQIADAQSALTLLDENGPSITVKILPYSFEKDE